MILYGVQYCVPVEHPLRAGGGCTGSCTGFASRPVEADFHFVDAGSWPLQGSSTTPDRLMSEDRAADQADQQLSARAPSQPESRIRSQNPDFLKPCLFLRGRAHELSGLLRPLGPRVEAYELLSIPCFLRPHHE